MGNASLRVDGAKGMGLDRTSLGRADDFVEKKPWNSYSRKFYFLLKKREVLSQRIWTIILNDLLGGDTLGTLQHQFLVRGGGDDDATATIIVGRGEEVQAGLRVFGVDAEEVYQRMRQKVGEDALVPLTLKLTPEVGTLAP